MVRIVVAAIDVGQPGDRAAGRGPHLRHIAEGCGGDPALDGIPQDDLVPLPADVGGHVLEETGVGNVYLVAAQVYVGAVPEDFAHFVEDRAEGLHSAVGLHGESHGLVKYVAVAGHIDLGDDGHSAFAGVGDELACLCLCVILSRIASLVLPGGELGEGLDFDAPAGVFRQVPVEGIDLESGKVVDLSLQLVDGVKGASDVMHEAAELEGREVGDPDRLELRPPPPSLGHLLKGLRGADHAGGVEGTDGDEVLLDAKVVGLVGVFGQSVVEGAGDFAHDFDDDTGLGTRLQGAAGLGQYALEVGTARRVGELHGAAKGEGAAADGGYALRLGQQVADFRSGRCSGEQSRGEKGGE